MGVGIGELAFFSRQRAALNIYSTSSKEKK